MCCRGPQTSGGFTASGTVFTTGVAVCAKEVGVVTALSNTIVNDTGNLHVVETRDRGGAVEADMYDTGDNDRFLPIDGLPCSRDGRPRTITVDSTSEGSGGRGQRNGGGGGGLRGTHGFMIGCVGADTVL